MKSFDRNMFRNILKLLLYMYRDFVCFWIVVCSPSRERTILIKVLCQLCHFTGQLIGNLYIQLRAIVTEMQRIALILFKIALKALLVIVSQKIRT